MSLAPGARLGPYEILSPLGAGGMGEVYRARDAKLNRDVALKILPDSFAGDPDRIARFKREAQVLASLNHPNIAAIYGFEESGGVQALVLELVEGPTLADRIAQGPIPLDEVLPIARQIAEALEAAHEQGIIHRDLKPANIKISARGAPPPRAEDRHLERRLSAAGVADGTVKVLDFGLAKALEPSGGRDFSPAGPEGQAYALSQSPTITSPAMMTGAGMILGTAAYMSPEQARGKAVDKRADIWAYGCVLYEMLTGRRAFEGDDVTDVLAFIITKEPDWNALPTDTPAHIRRLLRRCLQKDPQRRLPHIGVARIEIDEGGVETEVVGVATGQPLTPSRVRRERVAIAIVALLAGIALAAVASWTLSPSAQPSPTVRFEIEGSASGPNQFTLSPDGRFLAAINPSGGLSVRALDQVQRQLLKGTQGAQFPFWSGDSRFIGFFADGKLKRTDVSGTPAQTLADAVAGRGGTWNRENVILYAASAGGPLYRISASGGTAAPATALDSARQEIAHLHPSFHPDGRHFIFLARSSRPENSGLYLGTLDSQDTKLLVSTNLKGAFAGPRHVLFMRDETLMVQEFDARRLELVGEASLLAGPVGSNIPNAVAALTGSENGVLAYRRGASTTQLIWRDRTGKELGSMGDIGQQGEPAWSPDGARMAVSRPDGDIWITDLARATTSRFTFDPAIDRAPLWSADGSRIVFSSVREGGIANLYLKPSSGTGPDELLFRSSSPKLPTAYAPDGRYLVYQELDPKTNWDLWALPLFGDRKPMALLATPFAEVQGQVSPDGRWLAYASSETGTFEVYIQTFPPSGSKWQISSGGGTQAKWRGDGKELFYLSGAPSNLMSTEIQPVTSATGATLKAGTARMLFPANAVLAALTWRNSYDLTATGDRFLINALQESDDVDITIVLNWAAGLGRD